MPVDGSQKKTPTEKLRKLVGELTRRKVFQVTSVYLVAAWGLSAGAADIFEALNFPPWSYRYFIIALFSLTPVVIFISWVFEVTKSGIKRDLGSDAAVDQTTVLAGRAQTPNLTAQWLGTTHRFESDFVVGRDDDCALQIIHPLVSRRHAKFELLDGRWRVRDLGSANGTSVNGSRVKTAWLDSDTSIRLYPDGPELRLNITQPNLGATQLARTSSS